MTSNSAVTWRHVCITSSYTTFLAGIWQPILAHPTAPDLLPPVPWSLFSAHLFYVLFSQVPPSKPRIFLTEQESLAFAYANPPKELGPNAPAGPFRANQDVRLLCLVSGGRPTPNVTWWKDGKLADETFNTLLPNDEEQGKEFAYWWGHVNRRRHRQVGRPIIHEHL